MAFDYSPSEYDPWADPEAVFNTADTAKFLGLSPRTIQRMRYDKVLPCVRYSAKKVGHRRKDLIAFRDAHFVPATKSR
jgi:hypothetical protein